MSRTVEYVSATGLRLDGRRALEHRKAAVDLGGNGSCDGCCTLRSGGTTVVARVFGPSDGGRTGGDGDKELVISCTVDITSFAGDRRRRISSKSRHPSELAEAAVAVANSVVLSSQYPGSRVQVFVDVLQHDGSEKAAVINAVCLALADATVPMRGYPVAMTAGAIDGQVLCDLTAAETKSHCPSVIVAVRADDPNSLLYLDSDSRVSEGTLNELLHVSMGCATRLGEQFAEVLAAHAQVTSLTAKLKRV